MAAITSGEILFKFSVATGSAGNSTTSSATGSWVGKYISTTAWAGGSANDLFDDVTGAENAAATTVDYRCIFIHNSNTANNLQNAVVYLGAEVAGGVNVAIAVDTTAASAIGSATAQAIAATGSESAPGGTVTGLTYSSPTTSAAGLALGTINVGFCRAIWIRRTSTNSAALSNDGVTISVTGDTGSL